MYVHITVGELSTYLTLVFQFYMYKEKNLVYYIPLPLNITKTFY